MFEIGQKVRIDKEVWHVKNKLDNVYLIKRYGEEDRLVYEDDLTDYFIVKFEVHFHCGSSYLTKETVEVRTADPNYPSANEIRSAIKKYAETEPNHFVMRAAIGLFQLGKSLQYVDLTD